MRATYFISDLHLCAERPETNAAFFEFMRGPVRESGALYVLGDLFEYWIGDDQLDHDPLAREVVAAFAANAAGGVAQFFMHGNRDFLIGERFAREARMALLPDPTVIELGGERVLLMHGDTLCTDDRAYQAFRAQVRDPQWQRAFLAKTYAEREAIARSLRSKSDVEKSMKAEAIMDVSPKAVEDAFARHRCSTLVHGHTHRPAVHKHGKDAMWARHVLPDWPAAEPALCRAGSSAEFRRAT
ncbi:MAG: UDP-2,3-diacylglucosamine diphosphatase [Betaproteobacteria bacterium]|nr:UDP-2,3-diacylglucosamine diphosphatase [Betaproteobacteria bacterium]